MTAWLICGVFVVAMFAAQTVDKPPSTGAVFLLLPQAGVPVSFEQIEERSGMGNGSVPPETVKSKVYRDSYGRVRLDHPSYSLLIDSVAGSRVVLSGQIAYRTPWPKSDAGKLGFWIGDAIAPSHPLTTTTRIETLGKRMIEGVEFEGTRVIQTVEGDPQATKTIEQWHSSELKLVALVTISSFQETDTARIHNLRSEEPDSKLFEIPDNYRVMDVSGR
jgi:hypothetical protein